MQDAKLFFQAADHRHLFLYLDALAASEARRQANVEECAQRSRDEYQHLYARIERLECELQQEKDANALLQKQLGVELVVGGDPADLQFLLALVAHHRLQGHLDDQGDLPHLVGFPGDPHHGDGLLAVVHQQIDPVLHTQQGVPLGDRGDLQVGADHPVGCLVEGADALRVAAGNDDALLVHDVDVVVGVVCDALHKFPGEVGMNHTACLPPVQRTGPRGKDRLFLKVYSSAPRCARTSSGQRNLLWYRTANRGQN